MHTLVLQMTKVVDRELSRIKTFVLDSFISFAPLTAILDNNTKMSIEEEKVSIAAVELIRNANKEISRLHRKKLVSSASKSLLPLVKEDSDSLN